MSLDAVTYAGDGPVARITIDREARLNRLDADVVAGLEAAWRRFMAEDAHRVALLGAAGDRAFSAGADLTAVPHDLWRGIPGVGVAVDKPVVAAVRGWCVGGAMVLTTMADLLVAADDAKFSYPEVKVGFSGGLIATLGYVNRVVAPGELDATALELARRIAANAPLPSRMLKRFVGEVLAKGPTERAGIARAQVEEVNASADWEEGRAAFLEKRAPRFDGE